MNTTKNRFLLTTAVLLAGVSLASAQGMRESGGAGMGAGGGASGSGGMSAGGGAGGGAAEHSRPGGETSQGARGASRSDGMTQGRAGGRAEGSSAAPSRAERSEGMRDSGRAAGKADRGERQTVGQGRGDRDNARQSQSEREKQGRDQTVGQAPGDRDRARQSRSESDRHGQKDQAVGQGRNDRDHTRQSQDTRQDRSTTTGANTKGNEQGRSAQGQSTTTTGANTRSNAQGQNAQQGQDTRTGANTQTRAQGETSQSMSGRVQVSAQQQTRLQQSVLNSRNVERVRVNDNSINFRVNAGVVVPRNISVVSVSAYPALIDIYPDYRDDSFFVVEDEIVVLDRSRRIVDVIPAGPRARYAHHGSSGGGARGSVAALDLSPDEIRVVQGVLIERGLLSGEADGILGADTRAALITFQRQEGFQTTGSIDSRTVTALGVSNQISATRGESTTVGQGRNDQSAPQNTTGQNTGQSNAPANQNQTTGQAGQNQPSTSGQAQHNEPTTSGQEGTQQPSGQTTGQAPAHGTNQSGANQNRQSGQTNQNNAPPASTSDQPAQKQPGR
jgi:hypothetical protein